MKLLIFIVMLGFLGCHRNGERISIQYVGTDVWSNKVAHEKAKDVRIYRSDPMDSSNKAIYWLETPSIRDEKLVAHVDCGIPSPNIYTQANIKWLNDSTLKLALLNSHQERFRVIKNGNRFSITRRGKKGDSSRILFMEAVPVIPNKAVVERED